MMNARLSNETEQSLATASRLNTISKALSSEIQQRRLALGISQEELGGRAKLHRTYISDIERGVRNISFKSLCRIAWALDTDCASLVAKAEAKLDTEQIGPEVPMHALFLKTS